jgi:hypothetical protein
VEVLGRYSNRGDLQKVLNRLGEMPHVERSVAVEKRWRRRLSEEDRGEIALAYAAGESTYALAKRYGINRQTVSGIVEQLGGRTRYRILGAQQVQDAVQGYELGLSMQNLADTHGVGISTMRAALLGAGVTPRVRRRAAEAS